MNNGSPRAGILKKIFSKMVLARSRYLTKIILYFEFSAFTNPIS